MILKASVTRALVAPPCLTPTGEVVSGDGLCPEGSERPFARLRDVHLGVITSSLGGHGSDACSPNETQGCGVAGNPSNDDAGHLLSRVDACGENGEFHTFVFDGLRFARPVVHELVQVHELRQQASAPGHHFVAELR